MEDLVGLSAGTLPCACSVLERGLKPYLRCNQERAEVDRRATERGRHTRIGIVGFGDRHVVLSVYIPGLWRGGREWNGLSESCSISPSRRYSH